MDFGAVASLVAEAEKYSSDAQKDRIRASEYERGEMKDVPAEQGKSSVVAREVRAQIKKVMPALLRTLLGNDRVVEFQPVAQGDEQAADQATDYLNLVIFPETDVYRHVEAALHDACLQRNGILKWWFDERKQAKTSTHTGLPEEALAVIGDDAEIVEAEQREEMTDMGPVTVYDVKIKRIETKRDIRIAAVPLERFLIHPDAVELCDSPIVGEKTKLTRSDLIAMGYDRDKVMVLPIADGEDDADEQARRDVAVAGTAAVVLNEEIDYYDLFVRVDEDGDGIAELKHLCFAGGLTEENLLRADDADDVQFCDLKIMARPHQWEGVSLFDDLDAVQRIKTVLLRQTLDNIYWQNMPQPIIQDGAIADMDAVYSPEFGKPIRTTPGTDVRTAMGFNQVPFVAAASFGMMEYIDKEAQEWTGVSDASAGLPADALQNMTAKASAMIEAQGIGQTELMVRTAAQGLRTFGRGLLRMIIRHQDAPRTIRLRGEWTQMDPRQWNADMDCSVNTGLGAGTRERDMMMMQQVLMLQEKLLAAFGPNNPYVKPDNLWNSVSRLVEAAGLKTPTMYFTEPDKAEVEGKLKQAENQPTPEQQKMQMQMQLEQQKMQGNVAKEAAQLEADTRTQAADRETQIILKQMDISWQREKAQMDLRAQMLQSDGLGVDDKGQPVNHAAEGAMAMMAQTQKMLGSIATMMAQINAPKRIVRDANGDIIGTEPVPPQAMN